MSALQLSAQLNREAVQEGWAVPEGWAVQEGWTVQEGWVDSTVEFRQALNAQSKWRQNALSLVGSKIRLG